MYLVRHAQSRITAGVPDPEWPLSERGSAQAARLAEVLAALDIEEIHCSPYRRCRETIAPFVAAARVPVHHHDDLRERRIAGTVLDDFERVWRRSWEDFDYALPECESSRAAQRRIVDAVAGICARSAARTLAVSSHGNVLSLLIHHLDARFHLERASAMRNPDLLRLEYDGAALRWDEIFASPLLDEFASHHRETPIVRDLGASPGRGRTPR